MYRNDEHERSRRTTTIWAAVATVLLLAATVTAAHADWDRRMTAEIPFTFVVENTWLPAGEYAISTSRAHSGAFKVEHLSTGVDVEVVFLAFEDQPSEAGEKPQLVFEEVGGEHFLAEMHMPHHDTQWRLTQARTQKQMLEEGAEMEGTTSVEAQEMGS